MNDWIVVVITLFFSALCSGLEIAFNSTNRLQLEVDLKKNLFSAKIISLFFKNPSRFVTSLLIGNNISNIIYGIAMARLLRPAVLWILPASLEMEFFILLLQSVISPKSSSVSTPTPYSLSSRCLRWFAISCCIP